ncbi:MAG: CDP-glucose 4,6-dehydratase [Verrucomicrobiae bacterium]
MEILRNVYRNKRVWLTGGTGFKGSWLSEWLLALGAEVAVFSLPPPTEPALFNQLGLSARLQWQEGDICNAGCLRKSLLDFEPDFVFHLAAQPLVRLSYDQPLETYATNVMGTAHVLNALRGLKKPCSAVFITTDKCYENREWLHAYREEDPLGGYDPYSSSKAASEIAISSWRRSFFSSHPVKIASGRAGNVIGGGDWAADRIVPDCIRALQAGQAVPIRNKTATRPWQHVLEPLSGYLLLAAKMAAPLDPRPVDGTAFFTGPRPSALDPLCSAFNFGPTLASNRTVADLVQEILKHWPGEWQDKSDPNALHEAGKLNLATDKAFHLLGWQPRWDFSTTIEKTAAWYQEAANCRCPEDFSTLTLRQIDQYQNGE